jgi:predicted ATP-dependent Lon-type protease
MRSSPLRLRGCEVSAAELFVVVLSGAAITAAALLGDFLTGADSFFGVADVAVFDAVAVAMACSISTHR